MISVDEVYNKVKEILMTEDVKKRLCDGMI
jgi:hypothetical protein